ncbi:MAG: S41 family peptidase [Prevotella sp.]|nr:S41 family peptidase [Prevotella sp.]MCM1075123.1 S41 family peptidase [Ruminococcus sp.]
MNRKTLLAIFLPVTALLIAGLGFLIGRKSLIINREIQDDKLAHALQLIREQYVDSVSDEQLMEMAVAALFQSLDPHSVYIPEEDFESANDDLEGSFSGVGIQFQIVGDTVTVVEAIAGGPAEKMGIMAGDRVISANGESLAGSEVTNDDVFRLLRGKKGSEVVLEIKRPNSTVIGKYTLKRDDIPVKSVDSYYLMDDGKTGYIKLSSFNRNTFSEFMVAASRLIAEGAQGFMLDLRNNPGGFMDQAIDIANQFLSNGRKIVFTKARNNKNRMNAVADGSGLFQKMPIAVLINEYSASASEIIAGAIQDNDRGPVIGRRSYGKGLVQEQMLFPDKSAVRLTVARYYTPSGRSIQKEYKIGESVEYEIDILNRYNRGEFYHLDSIQFDLTKRFKTVGGRTVFGGGGIIPDYFVPDDTTLVTSYYINVNNSGLIPQYAYSVADKYRALAKGMTDTKQVLHILPGDDSLLEDFVNFAEIKGIPSRWYYINISRPLLLNQLKAFIVRDLLGFNEFYKIYNETDRTIQVAFDVLNNGKLPQKPIQK